MSDEHSGYIWELKKPTRKGNFVACLVFSPKGKDNRTDKAAKIERNIGRSIALQLATRLLKACDAPDELVRQVQALDGTGKAGKV